MEDKERAIRELHQKIEELARKQKAFQEEIQKIQNDIFTLDLSDRSVNVSAVKKPVEEIQKAPAPSTPRPAPPAPAPIRMPEPVVATTRAAKKTRTPIEEFIGTNLLNKIGIAILVIGIGFGVKYSIDHELINPLTRIMLGYLAGVILIFLAIRIKKNHANFSAVLLSGGMAVFYFITFAAYDIYQLIPQAVAFAMMVMFTAFTVFAAIQYNMETIGIIGLVGAYAVPFLLSDGSGRVMILFSYITIINAGILVLAFKKYWKRLYYFAFALTWLSYGAWWVDQFVASKHLTISLAFGTTFFITFYITFLAYKLIREEALSKVDLFFMLFNSFVFYGFGYASIDQTSGGNEWLGLFTVGTAVLHFIACVIIYKRQSHFRDTFYLVAGMVLVFLTLAVPVQLEGNWVTLVWALEASLLFWIGRTKKFPVYEKLSYPLILLASGSLVHDWGNFYLQPSYFAPDVVPNIPLFLNIQFATSMLVAMSIGIVLRIATRRQFQSPFADVFINRFIEYGLAILLVTVLFAGGFVDLRNYWDQRYFSDVIPLHSEYGDPYNQYNTDLPHLKTLWLIYYAAAFAGIASFIRAKFIQNQYVIIGNVVANALIVAAFLTSGLFALAMLRETYLNNQGDPYFYHNSGNILIRYLGILLMAILVLFNVRSMKHEIFTTVLRQTERVLFHLAMLIVLSSELVHWLEMAGVQNSFKLALSILWGTYALFLIILGLWQDQKSIRVSAMVLFGVTLIKLFMYDMADMSTISKTIVMIILGALMLVSSFLYNKYKRAPQNEIQ